PAAQRAHAEDSVFSVGAVRAGSPKGRGVTHALGEEMPLKEVAVRYALSGEIPQVALIGLATPEQVNEAIAFAERGPLPPALLERLAALRASGPSGARAQ